LGSRKLTTGQVKYSLCNCPSHAATKSQKNARLWSPTERPPAVSAIPDQNLSVCFLTCVMEIRVSARRATTKIPEMTSQHLAIGAACPSY
jgi:hypothetical protein